MLLSDAQRIAILEANGLAWRRHDNVVQLLDGGVWADAEINTDDIRRQLHLV